MDFFCFKNASLLCRQALTHSSVQGEPNYQRLEFLGDALLGFLVADELYKSTDNKEGKLTRMRSTVVSNDSLAKWGYKHGLDKLVQHQTQKVTTKMMADVVEALLGAVYLENGIGSAETVFHEIYTDCEVSEGRDAKSKLQEYCQAQNFPLPFYQFLEVSGEDHDPSFLWSVRVPYRPDIQGKQFLKELEGVGRGSSNQEAQQAAARAVLDQLVFTGGQKQEPLAP
jgi:ribonuclease-3